MKFKFNPLFICVLRTHGLLSKLSATFGMVRKYANGKPKPHQGIDLASEIGFKLYAVEDGLIVNVSKGKDDYGYTITLKIKSENKLLNGKYAFYAHCGGIKVAQNEEVKAGQCIGLTGDTGNAKGMSSIKKGGHLHFELRTQMICGKGLVGRIDPLPFIDLSNENAVVMPLSDMQNLTKIL